MQSPSNFRNVFDNELDWTMFTNISHTFFLVFLQSFLVIYVPDKCAKFPEKLQRHVIFLAIKLQSFGPVLLNVITEQKFDCR